MKSILSKADLYAYKIKMTLNQEEKISTAFGRTLSVLTFLILLVFTWFVGNDFIYHANPVSFMDELIGSDFPRINITAEYFPLAFGLSDQYGYPVKNDSIIEFHLIKSQFIFAENIHTVTDIELEICKHKHFPSIPQNEFDIAHIEGFYCPKNYTDLFLEGSFISGLLTSLSFVAKKCDFKNFPQKCASKEQIDKFISDNGVNYNIFYIENYISIGNYTNPLRPLIINKWKFFQTNNQKITNFNLQENHLKTDIAIFSTNYHDLRYAKLVEEPTDWINYSENDRILAMFNFHSSNISQQNFRKYIKISDILASVGGLIKISILFFSFIHKPFIQLEKFNLLLQSIKDEDEILNYIEKKRNIRIFTKVPDNNYNRSFSSVQSEKNLNNKEENSISNKNDGKFNNLRIQQDVSEIKELNNINNSEIPVKKVHKNNYFKDLKHFEKNREITNEIRNCDFIQEKRVMNNTIDDKKRNFFNETNNIRKKEYENKHMTFQEKYNLQHNPSEIIGKLIQNLNNKITPKDIKNVNENNQNKLKIKEFNISYCEFIKGFIFNLKIFKNKCKDNQISQIYKEYSKYQKNLFSSIDYSDFTKTMIKLRIMIDGYLYNENLLSEKEELNERK